MNLPRQSRLARVIPASVVPRQRDPAPAVIWVKVVLQSSPPAAAVPPPAVLQSPGPRPVLREPHLPPAAGMTRESVTPAPLAAAAYAAHSVPEPVLPHVGVMVQVRA